MKRPEGRAGHLSAEEKAAIRDAYFEQGGKITRIALAEQFNVNRDTVSACLKGPEFDKAREQFIADARAAAQQRLQTNAMSFADDWVKASGKAADLGNHKAAKEALQAIGVVAKDNAVSPFHITLNGFVLHGLGVPGMADYQVPELPAPIKADVVPEGRKA
jgi:hypothetical protein